MLQQLTRYVAIGDSFTEGLWDPHPSANGDDLQRGWADRLAETISRRRIEQGLKPLEYANHAIRGRLLGNILEEQLPVALGQKPTLISIIGGGNDLLRPGSDPDVMAKQIETAVIEARRAGAHVLLGTGMDPIALPIVRRTRNRVGVFNSHLWSIAKDQGAAVVDLWGLHALRHEEMWAHDRIHPSPLGHHRVAQAALFALGLEVDDPDWRTPLPREPKERIEALKDQGKWIAEEVAPWVARRVKRKSSGDGRTGKYREPIPVTPGE